MEHFLIRGGLPLSGTIHISGAKNAALPTCVASLLTDDPVSIDRVPHLRDVRTILSTISSLGKQVTRRGHTVEIVSGGRINYEAQAQFVQQMRASFLVLGPLVARLGRAVVPLPGGCRIGARPVDLHLRGLRALGAEVKEEGSRVMVTAKRLRGARISLPTPSVGATEQIMMSAALASGETAVQNASWEPEVEDLAQLLVKMGSEIEHRNGTLFIQGRSDLHGARHAVIPDRMEAGTYLLAGAITRGAISVTGVIPEHLRSLLSLLEETGGDIDRTEDSVSITMNRRPRPLSVKTAPYPGFPTDLQSPLVVLLATADGMSTVEERIFENRFTYARDLQQMGAIIEVSGCVATITGVQELHPVQASAPDIRAGAALVLAALAADGESTISNLTQIDRGYEAMEEKLSSVGAQIERIG